MNGILNEMYNYLIEIINGSSIYGPLLACLLIFFESIIPILPLFVFITILFVAYGYFWGFIVSYILTCLGCMFSFFLFRKILRKAVDNKFRKNNKFNKIMKIIDNIDTNELVLLIAIPFTPAFLINIAAGLSKIKLKKYFVSLLIGKISLVAFWGFIGTSLLESLKNPKIMLIIISMLLVSYLVSKVITKKFKIE